MAIRKLRAYFERVRQKRKELQMLSLSGVVRPSHIELRYTIPLLQIESTGIDIQNRLNSLDPKATRLRRFFSMVNKPAKPHPSLRPHQFTHGRPRRRRPAAMNIRLIG